jgi:hypothetical protein
MMGAVRRNFDTVTAQFAALPNAYLALTGGTVSGNLAVGGTLAVTGATTAANITAATITGSLLISTGNINAANDIAGRDLYASRNVWASNGAVTGASLHATGNAQVDGTLAANFDVTAARNMSATGTVYAGTITASGTITGAPVNSNGNINAAGTITGAVVQSSGAINGQTITGATINGQTITGATVNSNGNINAAGTITGAVVQSSGAINGQTITGATINSNGTITSAADMRCNGNFFSIPGYSYIQVPVPNADNGGSVGIPGRAYNAIYAYAFVTTSDQAVKSAIETPTDCLRLMSRVQAKTYCLHGDDRPVRHWGFIAQEVGEAMGPQFGGHIHHPDTPQGLNYNELVAVLWGAVRELAERLEALAHERR